MTHTTATAPAAAPHGPDLSLAALQASYRTGAMTPSRLIAALAPRLEAEDRHRVWIERLPMSVLLDCAARLDAQDPASMPLYGVPFAIKDNIDLAGVPTTAACPDFTYVPERSATVVERLMAAGAIPLGKTNMDQFATGLVGTRSPYGACRNSVSPDYIAGGSSSGSALAVALGLASFSLGTDTAGSGRVPAALNNLVGHKPTCGLVSNRGVVPACRSLDCVSVFARCADDAAAVLAVIAAGDDEDSFSRTAAPGSERPAELPSLFRFGVPRPAQRAFFGDRESPVLFDAALQRLEALGGTPVEIDFAPFIEAARLLYEGPQVAERYAAIRDFIERSPASLHPVTARIIGGATRFSAADAYAASYRMRTLKNEASRHWADVDLMVTPTAGRHYTLAEVEADPFGTNSNLGYYTNFMNLFDLCATAVPAGFRPDGLPFGITLFAPAFTDRWLLAFASRFESVAGHLPPVVCAGSEAA